MPPRGQRPTRGFSILNMKDDYEEAFETLLKAMVNQNPDIDADSFDRSLRDLVSQTGGGNYAAFASLAKEEVVQPVYSLAGDILSVAHAVYNNGDRKQAHELFESAMNEIDINVLIDAIQTNNKNSPYGLIAADEDEDETKKPDDETSDDENEIVDLNDEDDDQSDKLNDTKPTNTQIDISKTMENVMSDIRSGVSKEDTDEEETDKNEKPKKPMTIKETKTETQQKDEKPDPALIRAAANRISMRGSNNARAKAVELTSKFK